MKTYYQKMVLNLAKCIGLILMRLNKDKAIPTKLRIEQFLWWKFYFIEEINSSEKNKKKINPKEK